MLECTGNEVVHFEKNNHQYTIRPWLIRLFLHDSFRLRKTKSVCFIICSFLDCYGDDRSKEKAQCLVILTRSHYKIMSSSQCIICI